MVDEGEIREAELHTCSSDEQLKTGEVTLENPVNEECLKMYNHLKKIPVKNYQENKIPNFLC